MADEEAPAPVQEPVAAMDEAPAPGGEEMNMMDMIYPSFDQAFEGGGGAMQMFNYQGFYQQAPLTFAVTKSSVAGRPIMLRSQGSATFKDGFNAMLISQAPHPYGSIECMLAPAGLLSASQETPPALMTALALRKEFPDNHPQSYFEAKFSSALGRFHGVIPLTGAELTLTRMVAPSFPLTLTAAASLMQGAITASAVSGTGPIMYGSMFTSRFDGTKILGVGASLAGAITASYNYIMPPSEMQNAEAQGSFKFSYYNPLGESGAVFAAEVSCAAFCTAVVSWPHPLLYLCCPLIRWRSQAATSLM
jgi:hypothetical protein